MPRHSDSQLASPSGRPAWLDASPVIGSLIGLIGLISLLIVLGLNSMSNRFDDMSHHIHMRLDAQDAVSKARFAAIDARFDAIDVRFDAIDTRWDAVESEIKDLRQDVNGSTYRLDSLIGLLEAAEVIPDDVVPKSSTEALAAVGGP